MPEPVSLTSIVTTPSVVAGPHADPAAVSVTGSVADEVQQSVLEKIMVAVREQFGRTIEHELNLWAQFDFANEIFKKRLECDLLAAWFLLPRLCTCEHQQ